MRYPLLPPSLSVSVESVRSTFCFCNIFLGEFVRVLKRLRRLENLFRWRSAEDHEEELDEGARRGPRRVPQGPLARPRLRDPHPR
ncbi:hypothetical protein K1T71_008729 [Dendrolimus kikuchii]|uniref:Uncharacterized protein n=1 Tax=Dendrolimus kikuchii TaxID=765133 RepID=A0ACC1CVK8_9NEOP|nr:hypothetical protein K1T71_008729 [Dendrolimus kikuchii]